MKIRYEPLRILPMNLIFYKNLKFFFIIVLALALFPEILLGCGGKQQRLNNTQVENHTVKTDKSDEIAKLNNQLFTLVQMNVEPTDYLIGSGDILQVSVFEAKDLKTKVRVSSRGYVTLPLLGQVLVKGLSAREVEEKVEDLYRTQYIKDPHVGIFIEEHLSKRITIVGQVNNPGTYDYLPKRRLLDVIAIAGGMTDKAGQTVQVRRIGHTPDKYGTFIVDLDKLIKEGKIELNIEINGGDVIFVPEAGVFFVDGAVRKPGAYPIKKIMNIREALLTAGGVAPYAIKDRIVLIRYVENGDREIMKLDLKSLEAQELKIKDRDIVIALYSALGKLIHGIGITIGISDTLFFGYSTPVR